MENIKKSYKDNKFKISVPKCNVKFELPDGSYFVSDNQEVFRYILKKHKEKTDNHSIIIYVNKIENIIKSREKTGYYLELLMPKTIKLFGSAKVKITKDKSGKNMPYLEFTEVVLVYFNIVNNNYQKDARVLYIFAHNKPIGQLLDMSPKKFIFSKTFDSEFSYI